MPNAPPAGAVNWAPGQARVVNAAEVPEAVFAPDASTCSHRKDLGRSLGSEIIGLRIQRVPPGKRSSLKHRQLFQEEMILILSGEGVLLHGSARIPVRPMDCVAHLPSDPAAHCFENTGTDGPSSWPAANAAGMKSATVTRRAWPSRRGSAPTFRSVRTFSTDWRNDVRRLDRLG